MNRENLELLQQIIESQQSTFETVKILSTELTNQVARNAVLTASVGALYGELAKVSGDANSLDAMLARVMGFIEAHPDAHRHALSVCDEIRELAESIA